MARLPTPGSDDGTWGDILNDFLAQEHNADGTQKALAQSKVTNLTTDLAAKASVDAIAWLNPVTDFGAIGDGPLITLPTRLRRKQSS
jgi:hypothetical protein